MVTVTFNNVIFSTFILKLLLLLKIQNLSVKHAK